MHKQPFFALNVIKKFSTSNHIIKPKLKPISIPNSGLPEFLWSKQEKWFDRVAIESFETGRSYTYYEIYKKSLSLSLFIKEKLKLKSQDTTTIVLSNIPEYLIAVLGAMNAGLRVTTCNPASTVTEIKKQFQNMHPRLIFTLDILASKIEQTIDNNVPIIEISEKEIRSQYNISFEEVTTKKEIDQPNHKIFTTDISLILQSSGTTGIPKRVELTHSNLVSSLCQITSPDVATIKQLDNDRQEVVPAFLPFFHIYGMNALLLHGFVQGAKILTMSRFSNDSFLAMLKSHKPNVLFCTPPQVLLMIQSKSIKVEDLLSIHTVVCGAAPLSGGDITNFAKKTYGKVDIIQGYGQTELSGVLTLQTRKLKNGVKIGGSGFLLANSLAQVVDVTTQKKLGLNQCGELLVKGPQVMKGYLNSSEGNEDVFIGDGWLRTGDIGYFDDDEHFFITDRLKELIKVKGFQVAPAELEAVIREHPKVDDVAVIGVPHDITGEAPKAFIVTKDNHKISENELHHFLSEKVSEYKSLTGGIVFINSIPRTPSGKILRKNLK